MAHDLLHVISARCVACDVHMIAPGQLSVRAGDSSQRTEEIEKFSKCAFQCNDDDDDDDDEY